jgi:hypothetical protein
LPKCLLIISINNRNTDVLNKINLAIEGTFC